MRSDSIKELCKALVEFQSNCPLIEKNALNPHFRNRYADLGNVIKTIRDQLKTANLSVSQCLFNDGPLVGVETILMHTSGEFISSKIALEPMKKNNAQELGSFVTYLRRYSLTSILGIGTGEDDDGNAAVGNDPQNVPTIKSEQQVIPGTPVNEFVFRSIKALAGKKPTDVDANELLKQLTYWSKQNVEKGSPLDKELFIIDKELKRRK